jgi:hypothetical protein
VERRQEVVSYLRRLADKELAEIFYDTVRDRALSDAEKDANRHFVLADATRTEDGTWSPDFIAREDPDSQDAGPWAEGVPVAQWGICENCRSQVRSWAKRMLCPICGSKAYGS